MTKTLLDSPKYKTFTQDRNKAIEAIALNTQTDTSRILFEALDRTIGFISHMGIDGKLSINNLNYLTKQVDVFIWQQFHRLLPLLVGRIKRMRRATYILTYLSELEAIARATKKTRYSDMHGFKMTVQNQMNQDTLLGSSLDNRIWLVLSQLQGRILQAFQRAIALELTPKEVVDAVKKSYPEIKSFKKPPRTLKPLRESDQDPDDKKKEFDFYFDLTNDEDWELAVQAYKDTELPESRFDNEAKFDPEVGHMRYNWELEQDINDEFVQQVRDGQVSAATELGVQDFVWVAIIDKKTCDVCCLPRAGKTSSEIESMLASGELDEDECDAITPPAHPYCRCDIAPVASTDEVEGPDWKSFQDWLDS